MTEQPREEGRDGSAGNEGTSTIARPATRGRRRWVFRLLALLLGLVLVLIGGELILRVYVAARGWTPNVYAAALSLFIPNETRGYELAPDFRMRSGVLEIKLNQQGMRGPPLDDEKPEGVTRIAVLGGSSVFGFLVSDGEEAARLMEAELQSRSHQVQVINSGVPGYNLYQTTSRYIERVEPLDPDIVVLYLGFNDLGYICSEDPQALPYRVRPCLPRWERIAGRSVLYGFVNYRLIKRPLPWDPMSVQEATPTEAGLDQFERNLLRLVERIRGRDRHVILCAQALALQPSADETLRQGGGGPERFDQLVHLGSMLHQQLQQFADRHDVPFVDAYEAIPPTAENFGDYVHLTRHGEEQLAELWAAALEPLIGEPAERRHMNLDLLE